VSKSDIIPSSMGIRHSAGAVHDSVAVFSGGLDSTTLVYEMLQQGLTPHLLSFNYGQRHKKELIFAERTAQLLGLRWDLVDLSGLANLISNSALTTQRQVFDTKAPIGEDFKPEIEVPEGHYAEDTMKATVVPNRNMIMLSIAAGVMVNNSYKLLATGVHAGDHFVYPDCRPQFLAFTNAAIVFGNEGFGAVPKLDDLNETPGFIYAPFLNQSKADIAYKALELQVPFENTWSCYKGGDMHCGKCGTCVERLEAIDGALAGFNQHKYNDDPTKARDNTKYEDSEYWKEAIKNG
jgi:7-cyano-7-deazaguanine synthase